MTTINLPELKSFLQNLVLKVGNLTVMQYGKCEQITMKNDNPHNIASEVDIKANAIFTRELQNKFPTIGILTEEEAKNPINPNAEFQIIIDPLDGSNNFYSGAGFYAIMASVMIDRIPHYSLIYNPILKKIYAAETGKGATMNGVHITVSKQFDLKSSKMLTNDSLKHFRVWAMCYLHKLDQNIWMQAIGSCGISATLVADGSKDLFLSNGNGGLWDHVPPTHLIREAGGVILDVEGKPWDYSNAKPYIAGNSYLVDQLVTYLQKQ